MSELRLLRVSARHFVAGAVWARTAEGWRCIRAAPIIKWMNGLAPASAQARLERSGYKWEWV